MNYTVINKNDLPRDGNTFEFEGIQHADTEVSFIWVEMPVGEGIRLHKHLYQEIFIIQEGNVTFTVGSSTIEAQAGQIIIVPAGLPHKFFNSGAKVLKQIDIHLSKKISTQWLED